MSELNAELIRSGFGDYSCPPKAPAAIAVSSLMMISNAFLAFSFRVITLLGLVDISDYNVFASFSGSKRKRV